MASSKNSLKINESVSPAAYLNTLPVEDIGKVYLQAIAWRDYVTELIKIVEAAMMDGKKFPGVKLIEKEGRKTSEWADPAKVADILLKEGYAIEDIYKLRGLTDIKDLVGGKYYKEVFANQGLIIQKSGVTKIVVVPEEDPAPEYVIPHDNVEENEK